MTLFKRWHVGEAKAVPKGLTATTYRFGDGLRLACISALTCPIHRIYFPGTRPGCSSLAEREGADRRPEGVDTGGPMAIRRRFGVSASAAIAVAALLAACSSGSSSSSSGSGSSSSSSGPVKIGVDLTYNNTAFWSAYINYETQYAKQLNIKLIGPLLSAASASLQNQQIVELVNQGAKAIIVNPETATSLGPAITYAANHHVQLISVDTIVGVGKVYMVVRASNLIYGQNACAYVSSFAKSGYVLELQGDLASSNGADRATGFEACMAANDPGVKILKDPTVWTDATAVTDAQNAVNAYGSQLKAIYSQWSSPDTGIIPLLKSKGLGPGSAHPVL